MPWRAAMRIVCLRKGHRWAYAGAADERGYLEHCTRCDALHRVQLPRP